MLTKVSATRLAVVALLVAIVQLPPVASAAQPRAADLLRLRLPMGYIPDIQFAPFYVAMDKGYFAQEGIEFDPDYAFETNGVSLVGAGEVPFSIASGEEVLLARAQGLPVVYVFATYQKFPVSIVAKNDQNIQSPADLRGKKIGLPSLLGSPYVGVLGLLFSAGLTANDVTLDAIEYNQVPALISDQEQAVVVYTNNEPNQLRERGYGISELRVSDYLQLAADGIITNEQTISQSPELVRGMARALAHGLTDTINNPDEAYQISLKYVDNLSQADPTIQMAVLKTSTSLWNADRVGYSQPNSWTAMNDLLVKMGLLATPQDVTSAFTNDFVP